MINRDLYYRTWRNHKSLMLSAYCARGEDQTQYLSVCESDALPTKLSSLPPLGELYSAYPALNSVVLDAESRVCYPGNTAVRQPQRALTYCCLWQSTASQNEKKNCHCWDSNQSTSLAPLQSHPDTRVYSSSLSNVGGSNSSTSDG
jgi:hypothetical protein